MNSFETTLHTPRFQSSRRGLLKQIACGFGSLALAGVCHQNGLSASSKIHPESESFSGFQNPLAPKQPHYSGRAKRIIFIFMQGGPSHVDTFDYKPRLAKDDGKKIEFYNARQRKTFAQEVMNSPWKFQQHGECGQYVSSLFPHLATCVDDFCLIHSMHTEGVAHGPATLFLHTGATNLIRPSVGAWVTYGLGTENQNLPAFITINPPPTKGGPRNYSNGFLPASTQGTAIGRATLPTSQAKIRYIKNQQISHADQKSQLELLQALNRDQMQHHQQKDDLEATIASFELAWRMQMNAPGVMDLSQETDATFKAYGIGEKTTDDFGRQCLLARRFCEAGVRYVQINYADNGATPRWDQHSKLTRHEQHALATDQPVTALLKDLKQRGLLEDTIVWWGGEFGRTPFGQNKDGRDHNPLGFTVWLAGGGVKQGTAYGATDEYGHSAVVDKVHMHDLHATLLHLLGMNHKQLTFHSAGRDYRLTDIAGRIVHGLIG